jgi:Flp pilus assembly protein CpaB
VHDDRGAVAVLVAAFVMMGILGLGAIVLDTGQLYAERRELQNGADGAALSVVLDCGSAAGCASTIAADAAAKADQNANDGAATVASPSGPAICGSGGGLNPCNPVSGLGDWDCRPIPSAALSANYVQVRTQTRVDGGGSLLPPSFARILPGMGGYNGSTVRACARASWGGPSSLTTGISVTMSSCEWNQATSGGSNLAPPPPYPPNPSTTYEQVLKLHTTVAGTCPGGGASGSDRPGAFGWLNDANGDCSSNVDMATGTVGTDPGNNISQACQTAFDAAMSPPYPVMYIPVYNSAVANGSNTTYTVRGFAAFVVTGARLPASTGRPGCTRRTPSGAPAATSASTASSPRAWCPPPAPSADPSWASPSCRCPAEHAAQHPPQLPPRSRLPPRTPRRRGGRPMSRRITAISAALVLALLGTLLVVVYVGRADARALDGVKTVTVLVAKEPLKKGQTVKSAKDAGLITSEVLPRKAVPATALAELQPADEPLVFASDVTKGEILSRPRLVAKVEAPDRLVIPAGKMAVTVALGDPARVANFVTVGSDIAVFDSYNVFEGNQGGSWTPSGDHLQDEFERNKATRLLLPRVKVLAVGDSFTPEQPEKAEEEDDAALGALPVGDVTATLITVAVDQREAEKLIHGTQTGTLYLGLLDTYQVAPGPGVDNRTLFNR